MSWRGQYSLFFVGTIVILGVIGFPLQIDTNVLNFNYGAVILDENLSNTKIWTSEEMDRQNATSTLFVTGDVMLARHVEALINKNGLAYTYKSLDIFKTNPAYVLINFESAILEIHKKTPNFAMRFSTDRNFVPALREAGVTHAGLANNHTFDYGSEGFTFAQKTLSQSSLISFGNPNTINASGTTIINLANKKIGVLAVNALYGISSTIDLKAVLEKLNEESDLQIIYVHWGEEYQSRPSAEQRKLAENFIKLGADLIIGHHPHVVQSIEIIDDVPVFFSLGNFIFDQYFSDDVQNGLVLRLDASESELNILPLAFTSLDSHGAPKLMDEKPLQQFIKKIASFSKIDNLQEVFNRGLSIPWPLASSTEMVIMTQ